MKNGTGLTNAVSITNKEEKIMKKLISIVISLCMVMTGIMCCLGCDGEKPYVDTSNAAVPGQFDNPEIAKAKEAEDDAAGREHIEIPEGAETIEIDGEIYYPIDSLEIDFGKYGDDAWSKNYILTGDVDITGDTNRIGYLRSFNNFIHGIAFTGKFNGNNYKIYGERKRRVFDYIDGAEISNFVLSSELIVPDKSNETEVLLCARAHNCTIKNIVNYSKLDYSHGIIYSALDCVIDNVINYGDGVNMFGTMVWGMRNNTVINCKNYGNFSQNKDAIWGFGAIVGAIWDYGDESLVENCDNYGIVIGTEYISGIVGRMIYDNDTVDSSVLESPSIIRNCNNYGDIYRNKESVYTIGGSLCGNTYYYIGGIAGRGPRIEDCTNQGHIYGFESVDPQHYAKNIGGIAGLAISVDNCTSDVEIIIDPAVKSAGNICGSIEKQ